MAHLAQRERPSLIVFPQPRQRFSRFSGGKAGGNGARPFASRLCRCVSGVAGRLEVDDLPAHNVCATYSAQGATSLPQIGAVSESCEHTPNLNLPNAFSDEMDALRKAADARMHRDDFYAHCQRLSGAGLAIEVVRNSSRMAPDEYCFRPTRRGLKLVKLLGGRRN